MCFEHIPGTYNSAEQKELCILITRGNKDKVRRKKNNNFPLLQATVTWQPPRNLKYHSVAAYIGDLCERQSPH